MYCSEYVTNSVFERGMPYNLCLMGPWGKGVDSMDSRGYVVIKAVGI